VIRGEAQGVGKVINQGCDLRRCHRGDDAVGCPMCLCRWQRDRRDALTWQGAERSPCRQGATRAAQGPDSGLCLPSPQVRPHVTDFADPLGLLAGHTHINDTQYVAGRTKATDTPTTINQGRRCSTVEQIGLGVDLGLPLIKTNVRTRCDLDSTTAVGQWITAGSWVLQALSWRAATLVVAGYTGVVRRT
jgi:hypothetical protein